MVRKYMSALTVGVFVLSTNYVLAQAPGQAMPPQPAVSPYLNLLRSGSPPAINYYNLVRPQMQLYANVQQIDQLQQQVGTNRQNITALQQQQPTSLPATGHAVGFMNQGTYFMTMGQGSALSRSGFAGGIGGPRPNGGVQPGGNGATPPRIR